MRLCRHRRQQQQQQLFNARGTVFKTRCGSTNRKVCNNCLYIARRQEFQRDRVPTQRSNIKLLSKVCGLPSVSLGLATTPRPSPPLCLTSNPRARPGFCPVPFTDHFVSCGSRALRTVLPDKVWREDSIFSWQQAHKSFIVLYGPRLLQMCPANSLSCQFLESNFYTACDCDGKGERRAEWGPDWWREYTHCEEFSCLHVRYDLGIVSRLHITRYNRLLSNPRNHLASGSNRHPQELHHKVGKAPDVAPA